MFVGTELFRQGEQWVIGQGNKIYFWHNTWAGKSLKHNAVSGPLSFADLHLNIENFLDANSNWNFEQPSLQRPADLNRSIKSLPRILLDQMDDQYVWKFSTLGQFTNKMAYKLACGWDPPQLELDLEAEYSTHPNFRLVVLS